MWVTGLVLGWLGVSVRLCKGMGWFTCRHTYSLSYSSLLFSQQVWLMTRRHPSARSQENVRTLTCHRSLNRLVKPYSITLYRNFTRVHGDILLLSSLCWWIVSRYSVRIHKCLQCSVSLSRHNQTVELVRQLKNVNNKCLITLGKFRIFRVGLRKRSLSLGFFPLWSIYLIKYNANVFVHLMSSTIKDRPHSVNDKLTQQSSATFTAQLKFN